MYCYPKEYDVLVIGAGHAGCEAALAAARMGASTAILTQNLDTIGQMSCNPAIGGLAKGHMVREIDALGGAMGLNSDATGIQFRLLNSAKGPSVRAPRAQADKKAYQFRMKWLMESTPNLDLHQGNVHRLKLSGEILQGIESTMGMVLLAKTVVITTGTFMGGLMHVGLRNQQGGRMGDATSTLSDHLRELGFQVARLKTGTPCRLHGKSIDFASCEIQPGDTNPAPFSFLRHTINSNDQELHTLNRWADPMFHVEQMPCWTTYTNPKTHDIIRDNLDKSPMYTGRIEGLGPRYCPSIEDKVVKFADKDRHQVFLEPEGRHTHEFYVNGVSTSLPYEIQLAFIHTIPGLERGKILRPGYAVEYDFCQPTQLLSSLETKRIEGLFFAGQINGTSGYEEAAGQGLLAGINAALKVARRPSLVLKRDQAYLGVMIDDLVTKGVTEPYRMFTSRAEHRLTLRQDNADLRLTFLAAEFPGLVSEERILCATSRRDKLQELVHSRTKFAVEGMSLERWAKRPENSFRNLPAELRRLYMDDVWELFENEIKYAGYIERHQRAWERIERQENSPIPESVDFSCIPGLKKEAQQKLALVQPKTLGQASRISGVTPADLQLLSIWIAKEKRTHCPPDYSNTSGNEK